MPYCDSRSSCYNVLNFDTVRVKEDVLNLLEKDLASKKKKGIIGTGAMSDPYNPMEKVYRYTRGALKLIDKYRFGVSIDTKSTLVVRDIDILKRINEHSPVIVKLTITTYDDNLCSKIEPAVNKSSERFRAIKMLSENGIYVGVLMMPILPFINDNKENIRNIVEEAHRAGAKFIFTFGMGVTLRGNQREYYYSALKEIYGDDELINQYIETYGESYQCPSLKEKELMEYFKELCKEYKLLYKMSDIINAYKNPYKKEQITFF